MRVLVYGTLKRGGALSPNMSAGTYLGEYSTEPEFTLVNLGWFPGLIHRGSTSVQGEVYEMPDSSLSLLDRIEGYPSLYDREEIETPYGRAWVYVYNSGHRELDTFNVIDNGVWENSGDRG